MGWTHAPLYFKIPSGYLNGQSGLTVLRLVDAGRNIASLEVYAIKSRNCESWLAVWENQEAWTQWQQHPEIYDNQDKLGPHSKPTESEYCGMGWYLSTHSQVRLTQNRDSNVQHRSNKTNQEYWCLILLKCLSANEIIFWVTRR